MTNFNKIDPNAGVFPTTTTIPNQPVESGWSGRKIAIAVIGALAALAAVIGSLFLASRTSQKQEPGIQKDTPECLFHPTKTRAKIKHRPPTNIESALGIEKKEKPLGQFLKEQSSLELAKVLQGMEKKGQARRSTEEQIKNDAIYAKDLVKEEKQVQEDALYASDEQVQEDALYAKYLVKEEKQVQEDSHYATDLLKEDKKVQENALYTRDLVKEEKQVQEEKPKLVETKAAVQKKEKAPTRPKEKKVASKSKKSTKPVKPEPSKSTKVIENQASKVESKPKQKFSIADLKKTMHENSIKEWLAATKEEYRKNH